MKNVKLKFYGLGYNEYFQATICIYDDNKLIYDGQTYNGLLCICLGQNKKYKIIAKSLNEALIRYIYVDNIDNYYFFFNRSLINTMPITFTLKDYYYNLPIERGELILWQR